MQENFDDILNDMEDAYDTISMILDDDTILDCFVIDGVVIDNVQYLLVVSCDDFDNEEAEAFLLKQIEEDGEEVVYIPVEDENEYNKALVLLQENETEYELEF